MSLLSYDVVYRIQTLSVVIYIVEKASQLELFGGEGGELKRRVFFLMSQIIAKQDWWHIFNLLKQD